MPIKLPIETITSSCDCKDCQDSNKLLLKLRNVICDDPNVEPEYALIGIAKLLLATAYYNGAPSPGGAQRLALDVVEKVGRSGTQEITPDIQVLELDPNNPQAINDLLKRIFGEKS